MPVEEDDDDLVEISARKPFRLVAQRYWLPVGEDPGVQAIYRQLRADRWTKDNAIEAAVILASVGHRR